MRHAFSHIACVLVAALLAVLTFSAACAAVHLPDGLTAIEAEAFMGDACMTGLVRIPAGVNTVKADAFSGTGVFALELPATVRTVEPQSLSGLTYLRVESRSADLQSLPDTLKYIASPKGGLVQYYANFHHVDFYPIDTLIADGGFYYVPNDTGLTLLSAVDSGSVPASVTIPEYVDGQWVNAVSAYAFAGCPQVAAIALPVAAEGHVPASAMADCAGASVSYYGNGPLVIKSIKASNEEPMVGETVTFTVEVEGGTGPYTVEYEIFKKGSSVLISSGKRSGSQFDYCFEEAGDYIVSVIVKDNNAYATSKDLSETIFANQFRIILPESLQAGKDLKIEVDPIGNLDYYSVFIKDAADDSFVYGNGFGIDYLSFTVDGCLFESNHTYLIETYVYTRDGKEEKLENESLTITGQKPDAPIVVTEPSVVYSGQAKEIEYVHLELDQKGFERFRIKRTPATTYDYGDFYGNNYVDPWVDQDCELQVAVFKDGLWSEWSSPINIEYVIEEPPLVAIINEELYAGQPFSILIGEKLNATGYGVGVYDTNSRYSEQIYYNYYEHAGTFTLDDIAPYLHAGPYRLVVSAYVNQIEVTKNIDFMVLDQERPSKPLVRLQMPTEATPTDLQSTEEITTTSLNVPANKTYVITTWTDDGVEELYIKHKRNNEEWFVSGKTHVITNSKINRIDEKWDQGYINDVFTYQVAAKCNGVWSEWSDIVRVTITQIEPVAQTVIHTPETIAAGKDLEISFDPVEAAVGYEVRLTKNEQNKEIDYQSMLKNEVVYYSGYELSAGEYTISVLVRDADGNTSTTSKTIIVEGDRPAAPELMIDKPVIREGEMYTVTIDTSNASAICCRYQIYSDIIQDRYWYTSWTDEKPVFDIITTFSGYAYSDHRYLVSLKINNTWSEWAEVVLDITKREALPLLDDNNVLINDEYVTGEDIIVPFTPVDHATSYAISLQSKHNIVYSTIYPASSDKLIIPGYNTEEGIYDIVVIASADDYYGTTYKKTVKITGNRKEAGDITLSSPTAETLTGFGNGNMKFVFDVSNIDADKYVMRYWVSGNNDAPSYKEYGRADDGTISYQRWVYSNKTYCFSFSSYTDGQWSDWSPAIRVPVE